MASSEANTRLRWVGPGRERCGAGDISLFNKSPRERTSCLGGRTARSRPLTGCGGLGSDSGLRWGFDGLGALNADPALAPWVRDGRGTVRLGNAFAREKRRTCRAPLEAAPLVPSRYREMGQVHTEAIERPAANCPAHPCWHPERRPSPAFRWRRIGSKGSIRIIFDPFGKDPNDAMFAALCAVSWEYSSSNLTSVRTPAPCLLRTVKLP